MSTFGNRSDEARFDEAMSHWEERSPVSWRDFLGKETNASDETDGLFDLEFLQRLATSTMPFGRYKGSLLVDLPEAYVLWFSRQGWPKGELGSMLQTLVVIKENGLEPIVRALAGAHR
ncbi:MAG TPA: DUF3820 family protein [Spirochaetales bacterium]|nr:DUF3820 family protein [Spirochaetales bacterium]